MKLSDTFVLRLRNTLEGIVKDITEHPESSLETQERPRATQP